MSKAVKAVTRTVSNVVKGAVKVVSKVTEGVKSVAQSKFGKILITAAAIYFGGAALAGGFSSSAAGGSFLSGMGTGVANAASGLSTAWSAAVGGDFAGAGSALSSGFQDQAVGGMSTGLAGAGGAGATTQAGVGSTMGGAGGISGSATQIAPSLGTSSAATGAGSVVGSGAGAGAGAAGSGGIAQGLIGAAKIQAGTQLVGGLVQGYGAQKATEDQRNYEVEQAALARDRYNSNVGAKLWSENQPDPSTGLVAGAMSPYEKLMSSVYGPRKV